MLESEKYAEFNKGDELEDCDVVLSLHAEDLPQKQKTPEDATEEEKAQIKEENAEIKQKIAEMAESVAKTWSVFKVDFMGAPIRKALNEIKEENKEEYLVEIPYRKNEKYWIKKTENNASIIFSIHFNDQTDIALARNMMQELQDAKKIVSQAITVKYYPKIDMDNDFVTELNIDSKDASCGIISLT